MSSLSPNKGPLLGRQSIFIILCSIPYVLNDFLQLTIWIDQRNAKKKMRFHFTHTSLAKIRKLDNVKHWWGLREIKKPLAPPRNAGGGTV